ncbi:DUF1993 domain-containing protein [Aliiglaciecola sp. LCG003]|uniref:DUF1993 domain-containing protein n=1 Tax=Aliiglaciecola sp. LCG003 TaxID=3053655 RepID=UPI0025747252|nr:DUF1993 domain-containing protein [Aliiglaciecola sp. LCG003]WJG10307.1 DUF1993 domain-containing protein [Aliiglaciecola sp. LCG003]
MSLCASKIVKPVVNQYLDSLLHLLDKAQAFSAKKGLSEQVLLQSRLAPDMHPLIWQVQMISEFSIRCVSRLADIEVPNYPYHEKTFSELKDRIEMIKQDLNKVDDAKIDSGLARSQSVPIGEERQLEFRGPIYLNHFFLPNFFFHITTVYNILRHNGVDIGKLDFVGKMPE